MELIIGNIVAGLGLIIVAYGYHMFSTWGSSNKYDDAMEAVAYMLAGIVVVIFGVTII